jgi:hypothetical protein
VSIGTSDPRRLCNTSVDKQAGVTPKEALTFGFLGAMSSFIEEPGFQNSE